MVQFIGSNAYTNELAPLEYTPVPATLVKKIDKALNGTHAVPPCLNA
jgi:hypothetical protein